jgi:hypothetical protein
MYWGRLPCRRQDHTRNQSHGALIAEHHAQALHNLTAARLRLALLLNFDTRPLQFKRIIRQAFLNPWNPWNPWRFCFLAQFALKAAASY